MRNHTSSRILLTISLLCSGAGACTPLWIEPPRVTTAIRSVTISTAPWRAEGPIAPMPPPDTLDVRTEPAPTAPAPARRGVMPSRPANPAPAGEPGNDLDAIQSGVSGPSDNDTGAELDIDAEPGVSATGLPEIRGMTTRRPRDMSTRDTDTRSERRGQRHTARRHARRAGRSSMRDAGEAVESGADVAPVGSVGGTELITGAGDSDDLFVRVAANSAESSRQRTAFHYFVKQGLTPAQSAGVVGNLMQESRLDPKSNQSGGPGRGIAQWSEGGRWRALVTYARKHKVSEYSLTTQLAFVWYELKQNSGYGLSELRAAKSVKQATTVFARRYEACGQCDNAMRIRYANAVLKAYGKRAAARKR